MSTKSLGKLAVSQGETNEVYGIKEQSRQGRGMVKKFL
jgi:hypothetical protein